MLSVPPSRVVPPGYVLGLLIEACRCQSSQAIPTKSQAANQRVRVRMIVEYHTARAHVGGRYIHRQRAVAVSLNITVSPAWKKSVRRRTDESPVKRAAVGRPVRILAPVHVRYGPLIVSLIGLPAANEENVAVCLAPRPGTVPAAKAAVLPVRFM